MVRIREYRSTVERVSSLRENRFETEQNKKGSLIDGSAKRVFFTLVEGGGFFYDLRVSE